MLAASLAFLSREAGAGAPTGFQRVDSASLKLPAKTPGTAYSYEEFLPGELTNTVVTITAPRGETNRLFVAELPGLVRVIPDLTNPKVETFLDITARTRTGEGEEHGLCSMVFHPGYATNGQFFVFYSWKEPGTTNVHNRLSRFHVDPANPNRGLEASEQPMISQVDRHPWHNSGDTHFDKDGYLFVSLGDEGYAVGYENAGLFDHNFFSAVMKIDPDMRPGSVAPSPHPAVFPGTYLVPADNPFLHRTNYMIGDDVLPITLDVDHIRGEFYAIGLRNPWRFSIDPVEGTIYCNDVGDASREEVNIIPPGAHYGWFMKEGTKPWPFWVPEKGLTDPIYEYEHTDGRLAITGSLFYRGARHPEFDGTYLFADFAGEVSQMRPLPNGGHAPPQEVVWWSGVTTLGVDPASGDVLMGGLTGLARIVRFDLPGDPLPGRLSETGIFSDLAALRANAGFVPYDVNQLFWSDHAVKTRWFCVPRAADKIEFSADQPWKAPQGTVWVKHFEYPIDANRPGTTRRLETRVLVKTDEGVYGATYRWNDQGTDALLVPPEGAETDIEIAGTNGVGLQHWRFPSRGECLACHTEVAGHSLSFNTAQLNHDADAGGTRRNLLDLMNDAGYFAGFSPTTRPNALPRIPALNDESWSRESRIKGFLAANCVQCHQPGAATRATWDARLSTPLDQAGIVDTLALHQIDSDHTQIIASGDPSQSSMYIRLSGLGPLHMPPLGTYVVNTGIVGLMEKWITDDLPDRQTYLQWATNQFGAENLASFGDPQLDLDGDGLTNHDEFLLGTSPLDRLDRWVPDIVRDDKGIRLRFTRKANRGFVVEGSDNISKPVWTAVDVAENRTYFPAKDEHADISIPFGTDIRFFRIRVVTP